MLGGATAAEHRDRERAHVVVCVVLVWEVVLEPGWWWWSWCRLKWPTTIVTVEPFLAVAAGAGLCGDDEAILILGAHRPGLPRVTLKPRPSRLVWAAAAVSPVTSGTLAVVGAVAIVSVMVGAGARLRAPGGALADDVAGGRGARLPVLGRDLEAGVPQGRGRLVLSLAGHVGDAHLRLAGGDEQRHRGADPPPRCPRPGRCASPIPAPRRPRPRSRHGRSSSPGA